MKHVNMLRMGPILQVLGVWKSQVLKPEAVCSVAAELALWCFISDK